MTDPRFQRLERILSGALDLPPEERPAFLAKECAGDETLRREAESLLALDTTDHFLEPPELELSPPLPRQLGGLLLLRELGRGNQVVYEAEDTRDGSRVAVKVFRRTAATQPRHLERFLREAGRAGQLQHPNIVRVLGSGEEGEFLWLTMDLVDGHDLAVEISRQAGKDPGSPILPPFGTSGYYDSVADLCMGAAEALACTHAAEIVHRDIKPKNLILDHTARVRVTDFGIAHDENLDSLTRTGDLTGTPHYMSPEQARARHHSIDHRTDIYSLGVVLFELLSLQVPYQGQSAIEVLERIERGRHPSLLKVNPQVPRPLAAICARAMAREPADRYPSAATFAEDLRRFRAGEPLIRRPLALGRRSARAVRENASVAIGAGMLIVGAVLMTFFDGPARASDRSAALAVLVRAEAQKDWGQFSDDVMQATRDATRSVDPQQLSDTEWKVFDAVGKRLVAYREDLLQRGAALTSAATTVEDPEAPSDRLDRFEQGMTLLRRADRIFHGDPTVAAAVPVEPYHARCEVTVAGANGTAREGLVSVRPIDPFTGIAGDRVELGRLPLRGTRLAAGYYRFEVRLDDGTWCSTARELQRARWNHRIALRLADRGQAPDDMIRLPAGELDVPDDAGPTGVVGTTVRVAAFEIDRCEVSNAQYRAFVAATGYVPDEAWRVLSADRALDDRPATGLTFYDASAYADWAGKRLPTYVEWAYAARGPKPGRAFPWGELGPEGLRGAVHGKWTTSGLRPAQLVAFREQTVGVGSMPETATPEGVLHLFGNAAEWTESLSVDSEADRLVPAFGTRIVMGGDCRGDHRGLVAAGHKHVLIFHTRSGVGRMDASLRIGFRCARSLQ